MAFKDSTGCKVLVSVISIIVVGLIVTLSVCLTGHCTSDDEINCNLDCEHPHWDYEDHGSGPKCWYQCFPTCGGDSQSPIDLDLDLALTRPRGTLVTVNYNTIQTMEFFNNGHTVQGNIDLVTIINGIDLPGSYLGQQFHFHWGENDKQGSEHKANGQSFPLELHLVHYSDRFSSFDEAADQPQGLAVLGIFYEITTSDNPALEPLIEALQLIPYEDINVNLTIAIDQLIGGVDVFSGPYYRYNGSLTTPPCHESVVWTVFTTPVPISQNQLEVFRDLHEGDADSQNIYDNYRPVSGLNGRDLYYST